VDSRRDLAACLGISLQRALNRPEDVELQADVVDVDAYLKKPKRTIEREI
jgi:hypothetical protein